MRMFACLLVAVLSFSLSTFSQAWEWQHPWPTNTMVLDAASIDDQKLIMVGWDGMLLETCDDGVTWSKVSLETNQSWHECATVPGGHAWIVGTWGKIAYTHDRGESWSLRTVPINHNWFDVVFVDSLNGWALTSKAIWGTEDGGDSWNPVLEYEGYRLRSIEAAGDWIFIAADYSNDSSEFIRSMDRGETWESLTPPFQDYVLEMQFIDESLGWALISRDDNNVLYRTKNGGESWDHLRMIASPNIEYPSSFDFIDESYGWIPTGGSDSLAITEDGGDSWIVIDTGIGLPIREVYFSSRTHGWLTATAKLLSGYQWSEIYKTDDGGRTWMHIDRQSNTTLWDIAFIDECTGWAVGDTGVVLRTEDSGRHWQQVASPIGVSVYNIESTPDGVLWMSGDIGAIYCVDPHSDQLRVSVLPDPDACPYDIVFRTDCEGYVVTAKNLYRTIDRGLTWQTLPVELDSNFTLKAVEIINSERIWLYGYKYFYAGDPIMPGGDWYEPLLFRTIDGGEAWPEQSISTEDFYINRLDFIDERTGWAVGGNYLGPMILKTTNGGATWSEQYGIHELPAWGGSLRDVKFVNRNEGWAVGSDGIILHTTDSGNNWTQQYAGTSEHLFSIEITDDQVWICGNHGVILHHGRFDATPPVLEPIPHSYQLSVYPNPFNSTTNLLIELSAAGRTTVDIYNVQGRLVERLYDGMMSAGTHRVLYDTKGLPSGLYFANVSGGLEHVTKKLVLIR